MSRGQPTFKQSDLTKALKAAVKAGINVDRFEIDKSGRIVVVTAKTADADRTNPVEAFDNVSPRT